MAPLEGEGLASLCLAVPPGGQPIFSGSVQKLVLMIAMGLDAKMTPVTRQTWGQATVPPWTMSTRGTQDWHGPSTLETDSVPRPWSPWKWKTEPSRQQGSPSPLCFLFREETLRNYGLQRARPGQQGHTVLRMALQNGL